jgi:hypothetical protein
MTFDNFCLAASTSPISMASGFDLAYIDGMHLFEFALRDFMNLERCSKRSSIIVVDDVLPRSEIEADRIPTGGSWAGDVWKIVPTLLEWRKDLSSHMILARSLPTGCLIIVNPDSGNDVLKRHYDELVEKYLNYELRVPGDEMLEGAVSAEKALGLLASTLRAGI